MNPAYLETRFRASEPVPEWPREFVIISAYATTGESWAPVENEAADCHLASELAARGGWLVRLIGYSPNGGHAEPSWAMALPLDIACDIGRQYRQDAIYHVHGDKLSVRRCGEVGEVAFVGSFRERLEGFDARSGSGEFGSSKRG